MFKRNVEYILLSLCLKQKKNKDETGIQKYTTTASVSLILRENLQVSMEILVNLAHAQQISQLFCKGQNILLQGNFLANGSTDFEC